MPAGSGAGGSGSCEAGMGDVEVGSSLKTGIAGMMDRVNFK